MITGLRTRTILLVTSLVVIAGLGYGGYALTHERQLLQDQLRANLEATLASFAIPCAFAIARAWRGSSCWGRAAVA